MLLVLFAFIAFASAEEKQYYTFWTEHMNWIVYTLPVEDCRAFFDYTGAFTGDRDGFLGYIKYGKSGSSYSLKAYSDSKCTTESDTIYSKLLRYGLRYTTSIPYSSLEKEYDVKMQNMCQYGNIVLAFAYKGTHEGTYLGELGVTTPASTITISKSGNTWKIDRKLVVSETYEDEEDQCENDKIRFNTKEGKKLNVTCSNDPNAKMDFSTYKCGCKTNYGRLTEGEQCELGETMCKRLSSENIHFDDSTKSCVCNTGYMQEPESTICINGAQYCSGLNANREFVESSKSCECKSGYVEDSKKKCITYDQQCKGQDSLSKYDSNAKKCICIDGYKQSSKNNKCVPNQQYCQELDPNAEWRDNACKCKSNYQLVNQQCKTRDSICKEEDPNSEYSSSDSRCVCKEGHTTGNNGKCVTYDEECKQKDDHFYYDKTKLDCVCESGYVEKYTGRCQYDGASSVFFFIAVIVMFFF